MERALEEIVAADEELRARIASAGREARERVDLARAAADKRERERLRRAQDKLAEEIRAIAAATDGELAERRKRRAQWVQQRSAASEAQLPAAAQLWARIVRTGA